MQIVSAKIAVCKCPAKQKANSAKIVSKAILSRFVFCPAWLAVVWLLFFLEQDVIFRVWTILICFILKEGQGLRHFEAHTYSKFTGVPPSPETGQFL